MRHESTTDAPSITPIHAQGVGLGDSQNRLEGLRKMYIGYLLNCCENETELDDQVVTAYGHLEWELTQLIDNLKQGRN